MEERDPSVAPAIESPSSNAATCGSSYYNWRWRLPAEGREVEGSPEAAVMAGSITPGGINTQNANRVSPIETREGKRMRPMPADLGENTAGQQDDPIPSDSDWVMV